MYASNLALSYKREQFWKVCFSVLENWKERKVGSCASELKNIHPGCLPESGIASASLCPGIVVLLCHLPQNETQPFEETPFVSCFLLCL